MTVRFESMFVDLVKGDVMSFGADVPKQFRNAKADMESLFKSPKALQRELSAATGLKEEMMYLWSA